MKRASSNRIRIELTFGALTHRELADRIGLTTWKERQQLHPYLWQMIHRTNEVVKVGRRYRLRKQHTELTW